MDNLFTDKIEIETKYSHMLDELNSLKDAGIPWYQFESALVNVIEQMHADVKEFVEKYDTP